MTLMHKNVEFQVSFLDLGYHEVGNDRAPVTSPFHIERCADFVLAYSCTSTLVRVRLGTRFAPSPHAGPLAILGLDRSSFWYL